MIRKLVGTAIILALGAAAMWYALAHHIVTTADGRVFVPKAELTTTDTFVDITGWTAADFMDHPRVTRALRDHGHSDLIVKSVGDTVKDRIGDWIRGDGNNDDPTP